MPPLITVVIKNNIANTSIIPHISNEKYTIDLRAIFRSILNTLQMYKKD